MTALKEIRRELGQLVGANLGVVYPTLGANVNPPAVVVQPGSPYLTPSTYGVERVAYEVLVIAGPGDLPAQLDALDDMVDQVRGALRGSQFQFMSAEPTDVLPINGTDHLVTLIHVEHERTCN